MDRDTMMRWRRDLGEMPLGAWALLGVPALFVVGAVGGLGAVGGIADRVAPLWFYFATVVATTAMLVALALPVYSFGGPRRIETLARIAMLVGIGELSLIAFAPMAYGPGPPRTDWIEGTSTWVGSLSVLGSLAAIGFGVFLMSRSPSRPGARYRLTRAFVLVGAAVGTSAYHLVLLAISYDLHV